MFVGIVVFGEIVWEGDVVVYDFECEWFGCGGVGDYVYVLFVC